MVAKIYGLDEPENESERFALRHLRNHLPDNYLIIHNLMLDVPYKHAFEYDIIVIGEFAVYHIEVKGYRGRIEANRNEWLLLDSNEERKNPFNLAEKKSKALASLINRFKDWL